MRILYRLRSRNIVFLYQFIFIGFVNAKCPNQTKTKQQTSYFSGNAQVYIFI